MGKQVVKKLLDNRVLILRKDTEKVTAGGIIIPEGAKEKPVKGVVVQLGVKVVPRSEGGEVNVGDEVLFGKYSGQDIEVDGVLYTILREVEVFAVMGGTNE